MTALYEALAGHEAARLLAACGELGRDVLASNALLGRIDLPEGLEVDALDPIALRGKEQPLAIGALRERDGR